MATEPADEADVQATLRLGWLMAEARGRARPGGPGAEFISNMARRHWALPLHPERSAGEQEIECERALAAAASHLKLDWPAPSPTSTSTSTPGPASAPAGPMRVPDGPAGGPRAEEAAPTAAHLASAPPATFATELCRLGKLVCEQREAGGDAAAQGTWRQLARLLYYWDARIQDELLPHPSQADAYQLGRATAEMYWALNPDAPAQIHDAPARAPQGEGSGHADQEDNSRGPLRPNPESWEFLFSEARRNDISRWLGRLAPYFPPLTPPAVAGSIEAWGKVAASKEWRRSQDSRQALFEQTNNWYSLLVAELDPEIMLKPYAGLRSWRLFTKAFRTFGLEMVIGTLGIAALAGLVLLIQYAPHQPLLKSVAAVLGFFGVTSAGLQARLKATTQSMVARLSADLSTELVAEEITVTPTAPRSVNAKRLRAQAIESRSVTAPLSK